MTADLGFFFLVFWFFCLRVPKAFYSEGFKGFELTELSRGGSAHISSYLWSSVYPLWCCVLCLCVVFWKQFTSTGRCVVLSCSQTLLICLLVYKTHESGNLWYHVNVICLMHHHIWCPPAVSVQHPCVSSYVLNGSHCVSLLAEGIWYMSLRKRAGLGKAAPALAVSGGHT